MSKAYIPPFRRNGDSVKNDEKRVSFNINTENKTNYKQKPPRDNKLLDEIRTLRRENSDLRYDIDKLEEYVRELEDNKAYMEREKERMGKTIDSLKNELKGFSSEVVPAHKYNEELNRVNRQREEIKKLNEQIADLMKENSAYADSVTKLKNTNESIKSNLSELSMKYGALLDYHNNNVRPEKNEEKKDESKLIPEDFKNILTLFHYVLDDKKRLQQFKKDEPKVDMASINMTYMTLLKGQ